MTTKTLIVVNDKFQQGYSYELSEPIGQNFQWDFAPDLTPKDMLELGVFDGKYMTDCRDEFPDDWWTNAKLSPEFPDPTLNHFGIHASSPLSEWQANGWIHPDDPRGWFQWYCRYYMGRRHPDDARQISRWKKMNRHKAQVVKNCTCRDYMCRTKQRQALLHWAYDSRRF